MVDVCLEMSRRAAQALQKSEINNPHSSIHPPFDHRMALAMPAREIAG